MKKLFYFVIFLLILGTGCQSLSKISKIKPLQISIQPLFNAVPLQLNYPYVLPSKDSLRIETLKFYLSNIELYQDEKLVWQEQNSYHLADFSKPNSLLIPFKITPQIDYNYIQFNLGIDSTTNSNGVMGGDLDPMNGMYWTWQSGYINFKLEGNSPLCDTYKNQFQYHLGGYQNKVKAIQTIRFKANETGIIELDLYDFLHQINLKTENTVMSPSVRAVELSKILAGLFKMKS